MGGDELLRSIWGEYFNHMSKFQEVPNRIRLSKMAAVVLTNTTDNAIVARLRQQRFRSGIDSINGALIVGMEIDLFPGANIEFHICQSN